MNFRTKILEAIKVGEVEDILRGKQKYRIEPPTFVPDVFPTDINQVLFEYFYKQSDIKNIRSSLENALIKLTKSSATDLYISILFFDSILFMEDKSIATFKIDTSKISNEIGILAPIIPVNGTATNPEMVIPTPITRMLPHF